MMDDGWWIMDYDLWTPGMNTRINGLHQSAKAQERM